MPNEFNAPPMGRAAARIANVNTILTRVPRVGGLLVAQYFATDDEQWWHLNDLIWENKFLIGSAAIDLGRDLGLVDPLDEDEVAVPLQNAGEAEIDVPPMWARDP